MKNNERTQSPIRRFSSRRQRLDHSFLSPRLKGTQRYDRIAGYFSSSLLELIGEELETVIGKIRVVCNSDLHPQDVKTAKAAQMAIRRTWTSSRPETLLQGEGETRARERFRRLYHLLSSGKLEVKVLPDQVFGLIHGKAGVITLADGSQTCAAAAYCWLRPPRCSCAPSKPGICSTSSAGGMSRCWVTLTVNGDVAAQPLS
ncbi:MAG: hypothetical protein ACE5H9_19905 [Anaerolineae bacterium]